jgi:hypothetical protein
MYRKIVTAAVTAIVLATTASAAVSMPRKAYGISAAEQAWFDRASNPNTNGIGS